MNPGRPCPAPAELRALLDGDLGDADDTPLSVHLDGCPRCQRLLERFAADVQPRLALPRPAPGAALGRVIEQLKAAPFGPGERTETICPDLGAPAAEAGSGARDSPPHDLAGARTRERRGARRSFAPRSTAAA